ncbi:MAG: hypothetical protein KDK76_06565 [Chlamydiia bacterium]|nr:hypothetical protein [Chlamydiia bacterium]
MAVMLKPIHGLLSLGREASGSFRTNRNDQDAQPDHHQFSTLGLLFDNIVSSVTFRPPATLSELRVEKASIRAFNDALGEGKMNILPGDNGGPETIERPQHPTERQREVIARFERVKELEVELQKHQDSFNPIGGVLATAGLMSVALMINHWIANLVIPYSFRDSFKLMGKFSTGGVMFVVTKEAAEGWARSTDAVSRRAAQRCGG